MTPQAKTPKKRTPPIQIMGNEALFHKVSQIAELERRSRSQMAAILIEEALNAREATQ